MYFTSNRAVGGAGGGARTFNCSKLDVAEGKFIRSLTFWADPNCMRGCEIKLSNNDEISNLMGEKVGNQSDTFLFGDGERLTSVSLWSVKRHDYPTERLSGVKWTTSENRTFSFGHDNGTAYTPEVGSGLLIGIFGRSGADIDSLGFAILRKINKARLISLKYPQLSTIPVFSKPMSIKTIQYDNSDGTVDQEFTFGGEMQVETTSTWSVTSSLTVGLSYTVETDALIFSKISATASVEHSVSQTYEHTEKKTTTESFSFPLKVPAKTNIRATAVLYEANIDVPFKAKMVFHLDTGKEIEVNMDGTYKGLDSDQVVVTHNVVK